MPEMRRSDTLMTQEDKAQKPEKSKKADKAEKGPRPGQGEGKKGQPQKTAKGGAAAKGAPAAVGIIEKSPGVPRLKKHYFESVAPSMMKDLSKRNIHEVPRMTKIVVNMGVSEGRDNVQAVEQARDMLGQIVGQLPQIRKAKKSISNFKLRAGMPIGVRVTLRGDRMYEFFDRLMSTAMPRIRDFRGLEPKGFDGCGNFNLGLREHHIFPEVNIEKSTKARGMNITFVTTAHTDTEGLDLLTRMGMPFRKQAKQQQAG